MLCWAVLGRRNAAGKGVFHDAQPDETVPCQMSNDWECFHMVSSLAQGPKGTLKRMAPTPKQSEEGKQNHISWTFVCLTDGLK